MFAVLILLFWTAYYLINRFLHSLKVDKFSEKYVFITGCDTGFGHELAIRLDGLGFHVFAGCLTEDGATLLSNTCSTRLTTLSLDISDSESVQKALQFVQQRLPTKTGLWALVNNAGILGCMSNFEFCNKEDFSKVLNVNLLGPVETTRLFLPLIRMSKGRIVNITSIFGRFAGFGAPYCSSKYGLEALSDILRRELYGQGIKVSIVEPGGFPTSIAKNRKEDIDHAVARANPEIQQLYAADMPKWVTMLGKLSVSSTLAPVIDAYTHAITSKYPRNRYVVGTGARFIIIPLSYLPDWLGDWILRAAAKLVM